MTINIGLNAEQISNSVNILKKILADEFILYTKTRSCHWNIVSPSFYELHNFFETQYEAIADIKDEVAERIRSLGSLATGTLAEFLKDTRLSEQAQFSSSKEMLEILLSDHENLILSLRAGATSCEQSGDDGTNDFLIGIMEKHEKMAWMLRSFLS
jgi:starvation-inducible DNA-binding protein